MRALLLPRCYRALDCRQCLDFQKLEVECHYLMKAFDIFQVLLLDKLCRTLIFEVFRGLSSFG